MIHSKKELRFYIEADRIMAGEYHRSLGHKLLNIITNTPPSLYFLNT